MGVQRLGVSTPSANTDTLLYTADYPFLASVIGTNLTASTSLIDVWVVPTGVTLSSGYVYYAYQTDIPPSNTLETHKFALNIGDRVYVRSTQNTSFNISGLRQVDIQLATGVTSFQNTAPTNPINGQVWVDGDGVAGTNISSLAGYNVQASSATQIPFQVQGASGQTADLQQWDHVNGTPLARVDSTGLMYSQQSPVINANSYGHVAGKNKIINGDFNIWQRGTSFTTYGYTADRFMYDPGGASVQPTISRQTFTPGSAPAAGYEGQYFYRSSWASAPTGQSYNTILIQKIEDVRTLAGQTVTASAWIKTDSPRSFSFGLIQEFGSGGSAMINPAGGLTYQTTSTGWVRYTMTTTLPSVSGKTIGANSTLWLFLTTTSFNAAQTWDVWGLQLEAGPIATPFSTASGSIQGELAACQRYYYRTTSTGAFAGIGGNGFTYSTTQANVQVQLPVPMRTYPSSVDVSNIRYVDSANGAANITQVAMWQIPASVTNATVVDFQAIGTGFTSGRYVFLQTSAGSGYLGFSAEL